MTALTITSSTNKDITVGRLDGESVTINEGTFLIDSDTRWSQDSAVFGNLNFSSNQIGSLTIDASKTWQINFVKVSGAVPSLAAIGSNVVVGQTSGSTGELIRVWANNNKIPLNANTDLPLNGWIKLRHKNGDFKTGENLILPNGAVIKAEDAGKRSWINFVVQDTANIRPSRTCNLISTGDWYELGVTSGSLNQQIEYPIADQCPALQIETAPGSGQFQWWLNGGSRWGSSVKCISSDERGRYFGCSATGTITLALGGANACGKLPVANCRIRIPNIIVSNAVLTNWSQNSLTATKPTISTISQGRAFLNFLSGSFNLDFSNFDTVEIKNTSLFGSINCSALNYPVLFENIAVGVQNNIDTTPIKITNLFVGGKFKKIFCSKYSSMTTNATLLISNSENLEFSEDCEFHIFPSLTALTRGNLLSSTVDAKQVYKSTFDNIKIVGARFLNYYCEDLIIRNPQYADSTTGTTGVLNQQSTFDLSYSTNCKIDGFSLYNSLSNVHPYISIVNFVNSRNIDVRNIGTPVQPFNCGTSNPCGSIVSNSQSKGINLIRIYSINTRLGVVQFGLQSLDVNFINVQGDYSDSGVVDAKNSVMRGSRWTPTSLTRTGNTGKLWEDGFNSDTTGFVNIACNEPFSYQNTEFKIFGKARFDAVGNLFLLEIGDSVEYTQSYFCLGHESIDSFLFFGTNSTFIKRHFQIDTGSGFNGTWLEITTTNVRAVSINPTVGFKLKIKFACVTASPNNRVSFLRINTKTSLVSQRIQYTDLPSFNNGNTIIIKPVNFVLRISNIVAGSKIVIFKSTDGTDINKSNFIDFDFYDYNYTYESDIPVTVVIYHQDYKEVRFNVVLSESNNNIPILQQLEPTNLE
jgi:hypothetical protein